MASQATDLDTPELGTIARRLNASLEERRVRPFASLQYRLGEVGRNRINPRLLRRALAELTNNRRPRRGQVEDVGPWEPLPGLYVNGQLPGDEARGLAEACQDDYRRLKENNRQEGLNALVRAIEGAGGVESEELPALGNAGEDGGTEVAPFARGAIATAAGVSLWVTHELEWLYPDNPYLWQFFLRCAETGAHPLVIARQIDQTTFTLFRVLGARGLQYYAMSGPSDGYVHFAESADRLGWVRLQHPDRFSEHPVVGHVQEARGQLARRPWDTELREAVLQSIKWDLSGTNGMIDDRLANWARGAGVEFSAKWLETISRWSAWEEYKPSRRRGRGAAGRESGCLAPEAPTAVVPVGTKVERPSDTPGERQIFGRETKIERVPFPIRRW